MGCTSSELNRCPECHAKIKNNPEVCPFLYSPSNTIAGIYPKRLLPFSIFQHPSHNLHPLLLPPSTKQ